MCLIAYSPSGAAMPYEVFTEAARDNPDGIGVMSAYAVKRYIGPQRAVRAWAHIQRLAEEKIPHGVHFRWRTHGPVSAALCHPFRTTDGGTYIMHNGIIGATAAYALKNESDTSVFVRDFVDFTGCASPVERAMELRELEKFIGYGNKLLVLDMRSGIFSIANEHMGDWLDGFWYSNLYSHPVAKLPTLDYDWPAATVAAPSRYLTAEEANAQTAIKSGSKRLSLWRRAKSGAWRQRVSDVPAKEPMPYIDSEASYYRSLTQAAGYYDTGTDDDVQPDDGYPLPDSDDVILDTLDSDIADDDDYKALLRIAAANGRGR